ncbi:hypothetical protein P5673_000639 [Acropora cervicornis]|uniref:G-protein coupled receptors family 1 profile domain-containing protein n=1 Tax=Acropora cervicornis TaxID=6130 RepID=A0AAD9R7G4_ACRCE|nr:hypothetical protein P5673_000639 [Acropora cervicornis]
MALANDSKSEDHGTLTDFLCSEVLTKGIHDELRCISALNILLSVSAFLGNATVLLALSKVSALHPPSTLVLHAGCNRFVCRCHFTASSCCVFDVAS